MHPKRLLPSMSLLAAFAATARHLSFTRAANELFLTQSAVSRQVRALEAELGSTLIDKRGKSVFLTPAGELYAQQVNHALNLIRQATENVCLAPPRPSLNLALTPILGTKWLLPRLPEFYERHPDLSLHISTRIGKFDLVKSGIDAFLTDSDSPWPGVDAHPLMDARMILVASPTLLAKRPLASPTDLYHHTLLQAVPTPLGWHKCFEMNGLDSRRLRQGPTFEMASHLIQATTAGMGVTMISDIFVQSELTEGSLVRVEIAGFKTLTKRFYLMHASESRDLPALVALRDWIIENVSGEHALDGPAPDPSV